MPRRRYQARRAYARVRRRAGEAQIGDHHQGEGDRGAGLRPIALYERASTEIEALPVFHRALADPLVLPILAQAAAALRYGLDTG